MCANICAENPHPCSEQFNCCDCGLDENGCGCPYCWSCNACEECKAEASS